MDFLVHKYFDKSYSYLNNRYDFESLEGLFKYGNPLAFFPHRSGMVAIFLRKWTKNGGHQGECRELPPITNRRGGGGR